MSTGKRMLLIMARFVPTLTARFMAWLRVRVAALYERLCPPIPFERETAHFVARNFKPWSAGDEKAQEALYLAGPGAFWLRPDFAEWFKAGMPDGDWVPPVPAILYDPHWREQNWNSSVPNRQNTYSQLNQYAPGHHGIYQTGLVSGTAILGNLLSPFMRL